MARSTSAHLLHDFEPSALLNVSPSESLAPATSRAEINPLYFASVDDSSRPLPDLAMALNSERAQQTSTYFNDAYWYDSLLSNDFIPGLELGDVAETGVDA